MTADHFPIALILVTYLLLIFFLCRWCKHPCTDRWCYDSCYCGYHGACGFRGGDTAVVQEKKTLWRYAKLACRTIGYNFTRTSYNNYYRVLNYTWDVLVCIYKPHINETLSIKKWGTMHFLRYLLAQNPAI